MGNDAWHKLWNEWNINSINPILQEYCENHGIDMYADYIATEVLVAARKYCKAQKLWWRDYGEVDKWLDMEVC